MFPQRLFAVAVLLALTLTGCATTGLRTESVAVSRSEPRLRISGSGTVLPLVEKLVEAYRRENPAAQFGFEAGTNSGGAIRGVVQGTFDMAVVNRRLEAAEASEPLEYSAFARDALVFAVHRSDPPEGLTSAQIRDVYGGSVTDWRQLGGTTGPIMVLDRDKDESARKLVLVPLLAGRPVRARTVTLSTARDMLAALNDTPDSLGYTPLGLFRIQQPRNVRVLSLDGVKPGPEEIARGTYPWQLTLGLVTQREVPAAARRFLDFVRGPGGRKVLADYGYAPPGD